MNVLFVCSGNICRSPMAIEYFRHAVAREGLAGITIDSAGTLGIEGARASDEAIEAMAEIGVDLSQHRSKGLTAEMFDVADIVVAMSHDHLVAMAHFFPEGHGERFLLRAFQASADPDPNPRDLDDPIGSPVEVYRERLTQIRSAIDNLVRYVQRKT